MVVGRRRAVAIAVKDTKQDGGGEGHSQDDSPKGYGILLNYN